MSRYLTFDKIIIIKGVVKTSALNKDLGGEAHFFWPKWIPVCAAEQGMCMCRLMISGLHNYVVPAFFS